MLPLDGAGDVNNFCICYSLLSVNMANLYNTVDQLPLHGFKSLKICEYIQNHVNKLGKGLKKKRQIIHFLWVSGGGG